MSDARRRCLQAYTDTSVFGGIFDREFEWARQAFFEMVRAVRFSLLVSDVTRREVEFAPENVQQVIADMLPYMDLVPVDHRVLQLRDAYLADGILSAKWADDATHVAAATLARTDVIISWNFQHMVNLKKSSLIIK